MKSSAKKLYKAPIISFTLDEKINFSFTYTYANTVNTRIPTRMKHNMIRYCKWNVKAHPEKK